MSADAVVGDGLPHEVVLSIQRVLNIQDGPDTNPLDSLASRFSAIDTLNCLFPDGKYVRSSAAIHRSCTV